MVLLKDYVPCHSLPQKQLVQSSDRDLMIASHSFGVFNSDLWQLINNIMVESRLDHDNCDMFMTG